MPSQFTCRHQQAMPQYVFAMFFQNFVVFMLFSSNFAVPLQINRECQVPGSVCVKIWECPYFVDLLKRTPKPRPRSVIQLMRKNICGFADKDGTPEICCPLPDFHVTTTTTTPPPPQFEESQWGFEEEVVQHRNFPLLPLDKCGPVFQDVRITAGASTNPGEFPWMALIAYNKDNEYAEFKCGGTLINERYVLTAAHCIDNSTILGVRLGEHNIATEKDCSPVSQKCQPPIQDFLISKIAIHPLYDPSALINDIALVRLAVPANFTYENIQPVCLPFGDLLQMDLEHRTVIVIGWGVTEKGEKSPVLLKVEMPVIPLKDCQTLYKTSKPVTKQQICAGGFNGKDSCAGDSGGPLQFLSSFNGSPRFVQYGIVSYGPRYCGMNGGPGVYTRVGEYMLWILDNLEP